MLQAPSLARLSPIRHAFFTRSGGVSQGVYASLNGGVGSDDRRAAGSTRPNGDTHAKTAASRGGRCRFIQAGASVSRSGRCRATGRPAGLPPVSRG